MTKKMESALPTSETLGPLTAPVDIDEEDNAPQTPEEARREAMYALVIAATTRREATGRKRSSQDEQMLQTLSGLQFSLGAPWVHIDLHAFLQGVEILADEVRARISH